MTIEKSKPRKAWIIIADEARNPHIAESIVPIKPKQPMAVYPPQWKLDRLLPIIDGFVQFIGNSPDDMLPYLKPQTAPYRAEAHAWGQQAMGGYDPYIEAIRVDDLTLCLDTESGNRWFEYTRKPPVVPKHLLDNVDSE